jgi:hypothetical protein
MSPTLSFGGVGRAAQWVAQKCRIPGEFLLGLGIVHQALFQRCDLGHGFTGFIRSQAMPVFAAGLPCGPLDLF